MLQEGERVSCEPVSLSQKQITPPKRFTDKSLIEAITGIARFVDDPKIKDAPSREQTWPELLGTPPAWETPETIPLRPNRARKHNALVGLAFDSFAELEAHLDRWIVAADARIHGTPMGLGFGRAVAPLF